MVAKVPCQVCTFGIPVNTRRYGGTACDSCASFFTRSIIKEGDFRCQGSNDCLKVAGMLGKGCRRCRFDKCVEIGMSTNEWIQHVAAASGQPAVQQVPQPVALHIAQEVEPIYEPSTVFASGLDFVLTCALTFPHLVTSYLADVDKQFLTIGFTNFDNTVLLPPLSNRLQMLSCVLTKFPITANEFGTLIQLSLCKLGFKGIPEDARARMKLAQGYALSQIQDGYCFIPLNRLIELSQISQHFLNVFNIFC